MILIFFGLPGTGKTFLAREFTKHINAASLHSDHIRSKLKKRGNYSSENKQNVYDQMFIEADKLLEKNENLVLDATFTSVENRNQAKVLARKWNQLLFFILTTASEDVIKFRTNKKRAESEADFTVYQQLKKNFNPVDVPALTVDTTSNQTLTLIQKITNYIQEYDTSRYQKFT